MARNLFSGRIRCFPEGTVLAFTPPPLPSDDKRWKIVNGTMRKNGFARHALIETLHTVQSSFALSPNPCAYPSARPMEW